MISIDGRKIVLVGLVVLTLIEVYYLISNFFGFIYFPLIDWVRLLFLLVVAGGFGLKWLESREGLEFLSAGTVGLATLAQFIWNVATVSNSIFNWLLIFLSSLFYFVMAIRALKLNNTAYNKILFLLCVCGGLYNIFSARIMWNWLYPIFYAYANWLIMLWNLGYLVSICACLLEYITED